LLRINGIDEREAVTMIKIPVLAVLEGVKGTILELEIEAKKEGKGTLYLDLRLTLDQTSRQALKNVFSLLHAGTTDILIRFGGEKDFCLCGGSFALPMYLGMYACVRGLKVKPGTFATGCVNENGEITSVVELAEKIRVVLGKAEMLLVPKNQGLPVQGIMIKEVSNLQDAVDHALM
jgi:hypothetical protein